MNKYYDTYLVLDDNKAYCFIDNKKYNINTKYLKHALNGDKILVKVTDNTVYIQKVLERSDKTIIGRIYKKNDKLYIKPWEKNMVDFFCIDSNYDVDDIIEFKLKSWKKSEYLPIAHIIKKLKISKHNEKLCYYNIPHTFSNNILSEADSKVLNFSNRIDLTHLNTITIDPENCKDIDDALSYEDTQYGYRIGIHISDVSSVVDKGSSIDVEAYKRGFSIYHPLYTIPMLPNYLSENLCSLKENNIRLAISLMINFDREWNITDYYIFKSKINVNKNLSYNQAEYDLNNPKSAFYHILNNLCIIGDKLRLSYFPKELSINNDTYSLEIDDNKIKNINYNKHLKTKYMVQSWMLICNKLMTERIESNNKQTIYRTQQYPVKNKLEELKQYLEKIGNNWDNEKGLFYNFKKLLSIDNIAIKYKIMKTLKQAKYSNKDNHFMLGVNNYSHFTSPIRRYVDILNHRILINCLNNKDTLLLNKDRIIDNLNKSEQRIENFIKVCTNEMIFEYFKDKKIKAYITDFNIKGILLKTENNIDLFLPLKNIPDSKWDNNTETIESKFMVFKYGDVIDVVISKIDNDNKIIVKLWKI